MISGVTIIRFLMLQRVHYKHLYLVAAVWILFLCRHTILEAEKLEREAGGGQMGDPLGRGYVQDVFPPHRKVSQAQAYRALKDVRDQVLREYIGKDLPPWLNPEVNGSQPGLGDVLEGRQVRRAVIATTWRSGSTFLGDLLNSYPGAFYHFEPFHYIIVQDAVPRHMESMATGLLSTLLSCKFDTRTQPYLHHITSGRNHFILGKNSRLRRLCSNGRALLPRNIVTAACTNAPGFFKTSEVKALCTEAITADFRVSVAIHLLF
ncbi:uncharacterized protein [Macrobrachium rosenbergii]|uniref:uncharacterized protein n=1 Tax=Macrobrachium rosenbergii TaxID=79674 RepID=UPI0034D726FE